MKTLWFCFFLALAAVAATSVNMLRVNHQRGVLVNEIQAMKRQHDQLNAEWTNLKLEQSLLSDHRKNQREIQAAMRAPQPEHVVYLKR